MKNTQASEHHPEGHIIVDKDGYLVVAIGGGAQMTCPTGDLQWRMRYGDGAAMVGAAVVDSFEYLINNCTKEEAWRRILIMRTAMRKSLKFRGDE